MTKCVVAYADYYFPSLRAGGPIKTLIGMREELDSEYDFVVVTRNHDLGSQATFEVANNTLTETPVGLVYYCNKFSLGLFSLFRLSRSRNIDLLYLNSFFSLFATFLPLLVYIYFLKRKSLLIAPRGEFGSSALSIKPYRKKLYISIWNMLGLYKYVKWHASTDVERQQILDIFPKSSSEIFVAADCIPSSNFDLPSLDCCEEDERTEVRFVFVSRISPIKNLDWLLEVMCSCTIDATFDIYGPIEDDHYWNTCLEIGKRLPENVRFSYKGALEPDRVIETFACYDVFLFASKGENFGHVVLEALLAGTRVLVSDQTPWKSTEDGIVTCLDLASVSNWISFVNMSRESPIERASRRTVARGHALRYIEAEKSCGNTLKMFRRVMEN